MYDLERLAKENSTKWTYSEVVAAAHRVVQGLPYSAAVEQLHAALFQEAVASMQKAAEGVLEKTHPDTESFCMGYTSTYAPATFDDSDRVSMDFVRYLAAHLDPPSNA